MADYLFWHRANTENSGFFSENRYLDQELERESEREREREREGQGGSEGHGVHLVVCLCSRVVEHLLRAAICLVGDRNTGNLDWDSDNYTQKYIVQHSLRCPDF